MQMASADQHKITNELFQMEMSVKICFVSLNI